MKPHNTDWSQGDITFRCLDILEESFMQANFTEGLPGVTCTMQKKAQEQWRNLWQGDASLSKVRGKKQILLELEGRIPWIGTHGGKNLEGMLHVQMNDENVAQPVIEVFPTSNPTAAEEIHIMKAMQTVGKAGLLTLVMGFWKTLRDEFGRDCFDCTVVDEFAVKMSKLKLARYVVNWLLTNLSEKHVSNHLISKKSVLLQAVIVGAIAGFGPVVVAGTAGFIPLCAFMTASSAHQNYKRQVQHYQSFCEAFVGSSRECLDEFADHFLESEKGKHLTMDNIDEWLKDSQNVAELIQWYIKELSAEEPAPTKDPKKDAKTTTTTTTTDSTTPQQDTKKWRNYCFLPVSTLSTCIWRGSPNSSETTTTTTVEEEPESAPAEEKNDAKTAKRE
eukprot:TRINITY_DN9537_c0_g1_i1.p1 TRINITY_DN9537_c0_g1~~TRINITY_DN9537_c0_g1_i1.p1  ORF type:complete len:390 (+),score=50.85 TRINITY_DN9537_c0_g1_i1:72-1241(+)